VKGTQNAQMQGPRPDSGTGKEFPWITLAEGDAHPDGLTRV
jgi:hypothetical protein